MTLKEIAQLAGVSPSTVSRVINKNDDKCASKEVQNKIWKIVRETGYTPNRVAQNLKLSVSDGGVANETVKLACVFARVKDVNDQFFSALYRMVEQEAYKNNYSIQYTFSFEQLEGPDGLAMLENADIGGIVVLGRCKKSLMQMLKTRCKNVICAALNTQDFPVDQVTCDGFAAAQEVVKHLHSLGHTSIGYIGEFTNEARYKGYYTKMQELGLAIHKNHTANVTLSMDGGYAGARELVSCNPYPSAIFCCNDITAIGAIKAIKEMGLRIPEDISVISIDDIEMAQYVTPMLTTVRVPLDEMGRLAIRLLDDRLKGGHKLPVVAYLPFSLALRESCGRPAKQGAHTACQLETLQLEEEQNASGI